MISTVTLLTQNNYQIVSWRDTCVEQAVIFNFIKQDINEAPKDRSRKTDKFHIINRSTDKAVDTFESVVKADTITGVPHN